MSDITPYGYTCVKCPSRGIREIVGDFVPLPHYQGVELPQGHFREGSVAFDYSVHTGTRYVPIGFPDRCKSCNARYQRAKRAREMVNRLAYVLDNDRTKYLKFVTLTHATKSSEWHLMKSRREVIDEFYSWFVTVREDLIERFGARSGTDVLECIEHTWTCPIFGFEFTRYHVHQHGIWCIPYVNFQVFNAWKKFHNVGRSEITSIKDIVREDGKVSSWLYQASDYLSKYISKENTHVKRMVWGDVRQWRNYAPISPELLCKKHVKSTHDIKMLMNGKKEVCSCLVNA